MNLLSNTDIYKLRDEVNNLKESINTFITINNIYKLSYTPPLMCK